MRPCSRPRRLRRRHPLLLRPRHQGAPLRPPRRLRTHPPPLARRLPPRAGPAALLVGRAARGRVHPPPRPHRLLVPPLPVLPLRRGIGARCLLPDAGQGLNGCGDAGVTAGCGVQRASHRRPGARPSRNASLRGAPPRQGRPQGRLAGRSAWLATPCLGNVRSRRGRGGRRRGAGSRRSRGSCSIARQPHHGGIAPRPRH
mmetsp:Transcript_4363/g.18489  ORF Transcript_4363/g.18489 Transcript_4363/m.18489 type:complete len:200 (+) Transcript_4363:1459-2058(+)